MVELVVVPSATMLVRCPAGSYVQVVCLGADLEKLQLR